jgi:hypothetical protein
MLRIESLEIDDHKLDKIEQSHGVKFEEAEEAYLSGQRHVRRSKAGFYKVFCRKAAGRFILVVLTHKGCGDWKIPRPGK